MSSVVFSKIPKTKIISFCSLCGKEYLMDKSALYRKNQRIKPCCSQSCSRKLQYLVDGHGPHLGQRLVKKENGLSVEEEEQYVILLYLSGFSSLYISKELKYSVQTICNILDSYQITKRDISQCRRKYTFNQNFFENIDNEEKAYWYGFILADGCISKINEIQKDLFISLSAKDASHLEKFKKSLDYNGSIRLYQTKTKSGNIKYNACIAVRSKKIFDDLCKYGLTPNKSLNAQPLLCSTKLESHFWRGCIDGDGSIMVKDVLISGKKKEYVYKYIYVYLCGSYNVVNAFRDFVFKITGFTYKVFRTKSIYAIKIVGKRAVLLANYLYENSNIYLDRKYKNYTLIKKTITQ